MGPDVIESNAVLIVVGAHLRAEEADRPLGYELKRRIEAWRDKHLGQLTVPLGAIVCSDLWYLNDVELQKRPTVCIGGPGVNALTAVSMQQIAGEAAQAAAQQSEDDDEPSETPSQTPAAGGIDPAGYVPAQPVGKVTMMIDPDYTHLRVVIWGTDHDLTAKGVNLFCDRYLDGYLRACVTQVEPQTD